MSNVTWGKRVSMLFWWEISFSGCWMSLHPFTFWFFTHFSDFLLNYRSCIYVTGSRPSASAHALWDSGELHSLTERDSSFPHSTPGVVPSVPMCIQESISPSQPVYGQAGCYEKHKWQYLTHNVEIIVTRVREIQREESNGAHYLNPELMLLLDPSPIPDPCLTMFQEKGAPDNSCLPFYTAHKAQDDIHQWCKESHHRMSHITTNLEHGNQVVGNKWQETRHTRKPQAHEGHATKFRKLNTWAKGQQAACDTLSQALQHDLMMTALFKKKQHIVNK